MDNLENKTSAEIGILLDEKSKQISEFLKFHHKVEQEKLLLQRDILDLQRKKKDLEIELNKSMHNLKQMSIELSLLKNAFFAAKNSEL